MSALCVVSSCVPPRQHLDRAAVAVPSMCEIDQAIIHGSDLFLTACGRLLELSGRRLSRVDYCVGASGGYTGRLMPWGRSQVLIGDEICDTHQRTGRSLPLIQDAAGPVVRAPESRVVIVREQSRLRFVSSRGSHAYQSAGEIARLHGPYRQDSVLGVALQDGSMEVVQLPEGERRAVLEPSVVPWIVHDLQWVAGHTLVVSGAEVSVVGLDRRVFRFRGVASEAAAALSPDATRLVVADAMAVRCFSLDLGTEDWSQQLHTRSEATTVRWADDGQTMVISYPRSLVRIHAASGDVEGVLTLPAGAAFDVARDAMTAAACIPTLRGLPDELVVSHLRRTEHASAPPFIHTGRYRGGAYQTRVSLPDGTCEAAHVRYIDSETFAVRGSSLHIFTGGVETLSMLAREDAGRLWVQLDEDMVVELGPNETRVVPTSWRGSGDGR